MIDRRRSPSWVRALLVLAVLAGLVGMHQLVGPAMHSAAGAASVVVAVQGDGHGAEHGQEHDHASMLGHLCLAVLVALATVLAATALAPGPAPSRRPGTARGPTVDAGPAPVPVPRRLAALQVLRL